MRAGRVHRATWWAVRGEGMGMAGRRRYGVMSALSVTMLVAACAPTGPTGATGSVERAVDAALRQAAADPAPAPAAVPIACPPTRRLPAPPRGASAALVPALIPDAAVTCAYTAKGRLAGARQVGGVASIGQWLPWYPRATSALRCVPMVTGTPPRRAAAAYLIGVRYGESLRWLDAGSPPRGRRCTPAINGAFVARTPLYGAAAQTHASGTWSEGSSPGRLGDDRALVPAGLVATVTVFAGTHSGTATGARAVTILRGLRGVATRPVPAGIDGWSPYPSGYRVAVDYGFGSWVIVQVKGRTVTGGALGGTLTPNQARHLTAAIEGALPRPRA